MPGLVPGIHVFKHKRRKPWMAGTSPAMTKSRSPAMDKDRLLAFSDGVIAIIITIMVLELKAPHGADWSNLAPLAPGFLSYVLSFAFVAIYWNNHHHLLYTLTHVNGTILWANTHLLFWLSLIPFATAWCGENDFAPAPTALYGVAFFMPGCAYYLLQRTIVRVEGPDSTLARALGRDVKGKLSPVLYAAAIGLAFVNPWIAIAIYLAVAVMWVIPDRRIERTLAH
jgi:TMEM175 potassium channel family protein